MVIRSGSTVIYITVIVPFKNPHVFFSMPISIPMKSSNLCHQARPLASLFIANGPGYNALGLSDLQGRSEQKKNWGLKFWQPKWGSFTINDDLMGFHWYKKWDLSWVCGFNCSLYFFNVIYATAVFIYIYVFF